MEQRPDPRGKRVSLFVTCMIDMIYPDTGMSVVDILEHLDIAVDFPFGQTCCGQPAFNAGYRDQARSVAQTWLRAFTTAEVIVAPSGSCAAMVRHEYPRLFADDPDWLPRAQRAASITWEFSEYLVDGLGITDLGLRLPTPRRVTFHDACHGLRTLGLKDQARALVNSMENAEVVETPDANLCCGFGGLFSVKMPQVSAAMLDKKLISLHSDGDTGPDEIITGDVSCLTQINGGLSRQGSVRRVKHIADLLAEGLPKDKPAPP